MCMCQSVCVCVCECVSACVFVCVSVCVFIRYAEISTVALSHDLVLLRSESFSNQNALLIRAIFWTCLGKQGGVSLPIMVSLILANRF